MIDPVEKLINDLPNSSVNNSRKLVKETYEKSKKEKYGGYYSRKFEEMSGEPSDRGPEDVGTEQQPTNFD